MSRPKRIARVVRFVILLGVVLSVAWFMRSYDRYRIPDADNSLEPKYPAGSRVFAEAIDEDEPLERGTDVVYAMEKDGQLYARYGRVRALPGDVVGETDGQLTVNGELIGPIPVAGHAMGEVPPGKVVILATTPTPSPHYQDSRQLGFIARADVRAVIRFRWGNG